MQSAIVFLVVAVALVAGQADIHADIARITKGCLEASKLPAAQLEEFRAATDKVHFNASPELQCFAKCAIESGFLSNGQLDEPKFFAVGALKGKDEATLRAHLEKCRPYYKPGGSCVEMWELYTCFKSA